MTGCPLGFEGGGSASSSCENGEASHIPVPPNLSSDRATSSIPSAKGHWEYPSEQQFYRATTLKGHRVRADSVPSVVAIHNAVNEEAWRQIIKWESLHKNACATPKLIRFVGRPNELSLKARMRHWRGFEKPFDRHDWLVDRCGTQIRYLIDFYDGNSTGDKVAICVDARPDMATLGNVWDRVRMFLMNSPIGQWIS
ncbi:hypothetical protein Efla_006752 [Eimeria flavescens]